MRLVALNWILFLLAMISVPISLWWAGVLVAGCAGCWGLRKYFEQNNASGA